MRAGHSGGLRSPRRGLAYLEAQAAGLPIIAYRTAGVPEVVHDGVSGILTPTGDDQAYAQALAQLLSNEAMRQSMAESAAACVQHEHTQELAIQSLDHILQHHTRNLT